MEFRKFYSPEFGEIFEISLNISKILGYRCIECFQVQLITYA